MVKVLKYHFKFFYFFSSISVYGGYQTEKIYFWSDTFTNKLDFILADQDQHSRVGIVSVWFIYLFIIYLFIYFNIKLYNLCFNCLILYKYLKDYNINLLDQQGKDVEGGGEE
jgi:hypothetical protein